MLELQIQFVVGYVDNRALQDRPGSSQVPARWCRVHLMLCLKSSPGKVVVRYLMDQLTVELKEGAEKAFAQRHRVSDDGVKHRLQFAR